MDFLRVLDAVRSVTGTRSADRFTNHPKNVLILRSDQHGHKIVMVHDAMLAKSVLESPSYQQYNFVARILSVAKPERTRWIRRFCDTGLIMIDGDDHRRRRMQMDDLLDRCIHRLLGLPPETTAAVLEAAIRKGSRTSTSGVSRALVRFLFSECVSEITGKDTHLPEEAMFTIDFFNPFPTLSLLYRCDDAISRCCETIDFEELGEPEQAAILSLMLMGVSPIYAVLTAMMNAIVTAVRSGQDPHDALRNARGVDSYAIVPVNFVMRECVTATAIAGEQVEPGDILYLFLGSATGCPFSRLTSIPFGGGQHYCSGAKLTSAMLGVARTALQGAIALVGGLDPADVEQGKSSAFLNYGMTSP
jgi:hypothetical protein